MYNPLQYQFNNSLERYGYDVKVNSTADARVMFKEYEEGSSPTDYKYMLVANGLINQGDIITLFDEQWFVLGKNVSINDVYTKFVIRRLKFNINFNFTGEVISFPSAIDEGTYRIINDVISLPDGRIVLHMQENQQSKRIKVNQRFIIMGNAWKVVQKTNAEHGIYKLYADIVAIDTVNDDIENEIADRWKYESKDNYTIKINNVVGSPLTINSTLQLDITVTNNGEIVTVPLTYTSSNTDILTVDANGLVTCAGVGTANITVAITEDLSVSDTITIIVEEEPIPDATYSITSIDDYNDTNNLEIWAKEWRKYTVHKFIDNIEVAGTFTFTIDNPSYVTIQEQTDNTIKLYANATVLDRNIKLTATDTETEEIAIELNITIKGW